MRVFLILLSLMLASCSTVIPQDSNKSFRNKWNQDIVWNKKIYKPTLFIQTYDNIDSMFTDSKETQDKFRKANKYTIKGQIFTFTGLLAALGYLFTRDDPNMGVYWGIFGAGFLPGLYYRNKRDHLIDSAIQEYNLKKGYTFAPVIRQNGVEGGKVLATFNF